MNLRVREVTTPRELRAFQRLPWRIYKENDNWAPPLLSQEKELLWPGKHPFHEHALTALFLAYRGEEVVGRIGSCLNEQHNVYHGEKAGFFGFFECLEDEEAAAGLINAVSIWLKKQAVEVVRGPFNWSTNETCGLLVDGFDSPPSVMMTYNPPYYDGLMKASGLAKSKDLFAFHLSSSVEAPSRMEKIARRASERGGVSIRTLDKRNLGREVELIKAIYNDAWSKNWGFVPMTVREVDHLAKELKPVMDPRLMLFAEIEGEAVGFSVTLPDVNEVLIHLNGRMFPFGFLKALWWSRKIKSARLITLGIKEDFRRRGIEAILIVETLLRARQAGYAGGELGWVLEDNRLMIRDIEAMGARHYKTYRIYEAAVRQRSA